MRPHLYDELRLFYQRRMNLTGDVMYKFVNDVSKGISLQL